MCGFLISKKRDRRTYLRQTLNAELPCRATVELTMLSYLLKTKEITNIQIENTFA
jgi:hypothetical protein